MGAVGMYQVMLLKEQNQAWVFMQIPGSPFCSGCFISPASPPCPQVTWGGFGVAMLAL